MHGIVSRGIASCTDSEMQHDSVRMEWAGRRAALSGAAMKGELVRGPSWRHVGALMSCQYGRVDAEGCSVLLDVPCSCRQIAVKERVYD